jgi:DNA-binding MarR family transcriptional regulator
MARASPPVRSDRRLQKPLIDSPTFVLMQAGRLAMEWAAEALELFELTLVQYATLALTQRIGPMSQAAIAERLGISKAAMSTVASQLVSAGLAERRMSYYDARERRLGPTQAGAELLAEAADELSCVDERFAECIGEEVLRQLAELPPPTLTAVEQALRALGF